MTDSRVDRLIRELLNLYTNYGDSEFKKAIEKLKSGELIGLLSRTLRATGKAAGSQKKQLVARGKTTKKRSPKEQLSMFLDSLGHLGAEELRILSNFVSGVAERKFLPNAATLREYSRRLGLSTSANMDRTILSRKIGEMLAAQPSETRRNMIELATKIGPGTSTLQQWSDLIVKSNK